MLYRVGADAVLLLHLGFILFVVFGALTVMRSRRWLAVHCIAVVWGCAIEFSGLVCPLTYLENLFRERAGQETYGAGFVEHYLLAVIYPTGLTRHDQLVLGTAVLIINAVLYAVLLGRRRTRPG